jgi:hypothetical protein
MSWVKEWRSERVMSDERRGGWRCERGEWELGWAKCGRVGEWESMSEWKIWWMSEVSDERVSEWCMTDERWWEMMRVRVWEVRQWDWLSKALLVVVREQEWEHYVENTWCLTPLLFPSSGLVRSRLHNQGEYQSETQKKDFNNVENFNKSYKLNFTAI